MAGFIKMALAYGRAVLGSRLGMAISATCLIAFGVQSLTAPTRLPPIGGFSVAALGLGPPPPALEIPSLRLPEQIPLELRIEAEAKARAALGAAQSQAKARGVAWARRPEIAPYLNLLGFVLGVFGLATSTAMRAAHLRAIGA